MTRSINLLSKKREYRWENALLLHRWLSTAPTHSCFLICGQSWSGRLAAAQSCSFPRRRISPPGSWGRQRSVAFGHWGTLTGWQSPPALTAGRTCGQWCQSELYCSLCQRATSENLQRESVRNTLNQMQKGLSLWRVYQGTVTGLGPHVWGEGKGVAGVLETQGRLEGTSCVSVLLHPRFVQTQAAESWWHSGGALAAAGALSLEWGILVSALRWFIEISTQSLSTIQLFLGKVKAAEPVLVGSYCPIYHFRTENAS